MALLVQGVRSVLNRSACLIKNVAPRAVCVYSQQQRLHSRMTAAPSFNILLQVRFFSLSNSSLNDFKLIVICVCIKNRISEIFLQKHLR